jgi:fluoride exporter
MIQSLPLVALGGAIGAVLRFLAVGLWPAPWGIMAVNVLGCLLMGALFVLLEGRAVWIFFLMTGVLGGFTTFSAYALDTMKLFQAGQMLTALTYAGGTVILSLGAVGLGAFIARGIAP